MAPWKWSLIASLAGLLLLGLPTEVKLDVPTEENKIASAEECKVHIEKALEQYWEHSEPEKSNNDVKQLDSPDSLTSNDDDDDDEDNIPQQIINGNDEKNYDDDDDDDDDDGDEDDADSEKENETENEMENERNEQSDQPENTYDSDEAADGNDQADDDDDDDDDSDDDDDDNSYIPISDATEPEDESDKTEKANYETDATENKINADEDGESADHDQQENDVISGESSEDTVLNDQLIDDQSSVSDHSEDTLSIEESDDDYDDDDDDDGDDGDKDVGKKSEESESTEEEQVDEDDGGDESETKVDDLTTEETSDAETLLYETEAESDKVTGDDYRASSGVVSELSENKPSVEQSKASTVSEEALHVTEQDQTTEDDEEILLSYSVPEDKDDDTIENIYEEDDEESPTPLTFRSRDHIDVILELDEIGTEYEKEEEKLAQSIFKEIKKIQLTNIKPIEMLYKYTDSTTRVLGDAEIFNKPMILFLGPWNSGKSTIINYLLGTERTPAALKTGTGITDVDFTIVTYGDQKQVVSGMELAADWRYSGVQKFGQGFLDHFRSIKIPSTLLKKVTIVDTPGIIENIKNTERSYSLNDALQWFIDRADAIYVVLDPTKVDIGSELGSVLDQLKGREVRFILNKADTIRRSDLMRVVGQLFWNLSPLMSSTEAPIIYAVSLSTRPYHLSAPARFLADQENNFLYDLKDTLDQRVENRILYARRHAVRVRNHAKMVDCYLATYYRHKSIFSNKKNVAKLITENPKEYHIYEGLGSFTNVSRYDLPDPITYREFFKMNPLYDFKPLASTCSYFRGCPMDKLDSAIAQDIPELFAKYKKAKESSDPAKQEGR